MLTATHTRHPREEKLSGFQLVMLLLSIYTIAALAVEVFFRLSPETSRILAIVDLPVSMVFMYDFFHRLYEASNKKAFMKWGWIDFISSIPTIEWLRIGRVMRIMKLFRIIRAFRSTKHLLEHIFARRRNTVALASCVAGLMIVFSSIAILQIETGPNANILTASDALWWAFETTSGLSYGDLYPTTNAGRILSAFLMTVGVGLFGVFAGVITSWFIGERKER